MSTIQNVSAKNISDRKVHRVFLDLAVAKSLQSTRMVTDADDADADDDDDDV